MNKQRLSADITDEVIFGGGITCDGTSTTTPAAGFLSSQYKSRTSEQACESRVISIPVPRLASSSILLFCKAA
jgi:hypothetical protein